LQKTPQYVEMTLKLLLQMIISEYRHEAKWFISDSQCCWRCYYTAV